VSLLKEGTHSPELESVSSANDLDQRKRPLNQPQPADAAAFLSSIGSLDVDHVVEAATAMLAGWIGDPGDVAAIAVVADPSTLALDPSVSAQGFGGSPRVVCQADLIVQQTTVVAGPRRLRRGVRIVVSGYADAGVDGFFDIDVHAPTLTVVDAVAFPGDPVAPAPARTTGTPLVVRLTRTPTSTVSRCSIDGGSGLLLTGYASKYDGKTPMMSTVVLRGDLADSIQMLKGTRELEIYDCHVVRTYGAITVSADGDVLQPTHMMTGFFHEGVLKS